MLKNRGYFNAEQRESLATVILNKLFGMKAHADELDNPDPEENEGGEGGKTPTAPVINYEQLIASARKEEKDKLYPTINKLKEDNKKLVESNNNYIIKLATVNNELELLKASGDTQEVKELRAEKERLEKEIDTLKNSTPDEATIRAQLEAEYEVKSYLTTVLADNKDNILPTFAKSIKGKTKEEIDASLEIALADTLDTKKALGLVDEDGKPITTTKTPPKKEKPPVANPSGAKDKQYDIEYVRNLKPGSKEYKEYREAMGLK